MQAGLIDILEVLNARCIKAEDNELALGYARKHNLPMSAGSDAHTLMEVGRAYVEIPPFDTPQDFLSALKQGKVGGHRSSQLIHIGSTWAKLVKTVTGT